MDSPTRKLLAIMFTDLVDYTALVQKDELDAFQKRNRFEEIVRSNHNLHGGQIIQFLGDGTVSTFQSALNAIQCAIDIQKQLLKDSSIKLRIGIHSGEVLMDGKGIFGDGVNIASRIETFSVGGSILFSDAVYEQITNHPEIKCQDLGLFHLKNIDKPMRIFAVREEGVVLPSQDDLSGKGASIEKRQVQNLPRNITKLFGREEIIKEVLDFVHKSPIITLTGPGGTGKTRLAQAIAQKLVNEFDHGVYWIELAAIKTPEEFPFTLGKALSILQDPSNVMLKLINKHLADKNALLILDNFEHIIDAAPDIQKILDDCPHIKFLITSRVTLNLVGEQEFPVGPLKIPEPHKRYDPKQLLKFHSIELFCDRARKVNPHFELTEQNAPYVTEICAKLDGLPLAIELAAARIKLFSTKTLSEKLKKSLDILKSDQVNRPERHHTLRQTINWSVELLPAAEKMLFQHLAAFSGGASIEDVEKVCTKAGCKSDQIMDNLMALAHKSLIFIDYDEIQGTRIKMLGTIRTFAKELLQDSGEEEKVRNIHMDYFLKKAEEIEKHLTGQHASEWLNALELDLNNYRSATTWSIQRENLEISFRLGLSLWRLWYTRGMLAEAISLANHLLEISKGKHISKYRYQVMETLGVAYFYTSEYNKAVPLFEECLAFWEVEDDDEARIAVLRNHLGFARINIGQTQEGINLSYAALFTWEKLNELRGQSLSYNNLGWALISLGRPSEAIPYLRKGLHLRKVIKDERGEAFASINLAWALGFTNQKDEAREYLEKEIQILGTINDRIVMSWGMFIKAQIEFEDNNLDLCTEILNNAKQITNLTSTRHVDGWSQYLNGLMDCANEEYSVSHKNIHQGIRIFESNGYMFYQARGWYFMGYVSYKAKKYKEALTFVVKSIELNQSLGCQMGMAENYELAAFALAALGKITDSCAFLEKSDVMRKNLETPTPKYILNDTQMVQNTIHASLSEEERKVIKEKISVIAPEALKEIVNFKEESIKF